jgi:hypothetical protein
VHNGIVQKTKEKKVLPYSSTEVNQWKEKKSVKVQYKRHSLCRRKTQMPLETFMEA